MGIVSGTPGPNLIALEEALLQAGYVKVSTLAGNHPQLSALLPDFIAAAIPVFSQIMKTKYGMTSDQIASAISQLPALTAQIASDNQKISIAAADITAQNALISGQTSQITSDQALLLLRGGDPTDPTTIALNAEISSLQAAIAAEQAQIQADIITQEEATSDLQAAQIALNAIIAQWNGLTITEEKLFKEFYSGDTFPPVKSS